MVSDWATLPGGVKICKMAPGAEDVGTRIILASYLALGVAIVEADHTSRRYPRTAYDVAMDLVSPGPKGGYA